MHKDPHRELHIQPNQPSWSCLIRSHLSQGAPREALAVYNQIRFKGLYILGLVPLVIKACVASPSLIKYANSLHGEAIKNGVDLDVVVGTSLLAMYSKCGEIVNSRKVFEFMPERNVVTWNAMLGGFIRNGDMGSASDLFRKMPVRTPVSWNQMINGFARSGDLVAARCMFDQVPNEMKSIVTWTVMIDGYARNGDMVAAKLLFEEMPEKNFFVWSSMISGYCKIGDMKEARAIFYGIQSRSLVIWNSLICGYAQNGYCEEALDAFGKLQAEGFEPDEVTAVGVLSACAQLSALDFGKDIHRMMYDKGTRHNEFVMTALVDMYAKCGDLISAKSIFEEMLNKNIACWNAMISGFAAHGQSREALEFFRRMEKSKEKPDEVTFLSVLSACAHGGFVDEGLEIFSAMEKHGLAASIKHYGCVVDLLGRAGRLRDAYNLIRAMPMKPNVAVWSALISACRIHLDVDIAEQVLDEVGSLEAEDNPYYVLLSNAYAASDSWEKAGRTRMVMLSKGLKKTPGHSCHYGETVSNPSD